jgi:TatD DNase family protein
VLVDTHCHLDINSFDLDRQEVVQRAREAGVERILNPGIDLRSSQEAVRLSEDFPEVFASAGIHPNETGAWDAESLEAIRAIASHPKVVAIGEIGLDYYWNKTPRALQQQVFRSQLDLAGEMDKPVIIHNREAGDDVLDILEGWVEQLRKSASLLTERPGVLHSFSGDESLACRAIEAGFFIGFTGPVTFKNAGDLQEVAKRIPLEKVLIETDAPFLAPHPVRGRRNEPANVRFIAMKIAELRNLQVNDFIHQTSINASRLFCW